MTVLRERNECCQKDGRHIGCCRSCEAKHGSGKHAKRVLYNTNICITNYSMMLQARGLFGVSINIKQDDRGRVVQRMVGEEMDGWGRGVAERKETKKENGDIYRSVEKE